MIYNTLSDMLLDNRNGLAKELQRLNASEEILDAVMNAYDWVATEYIQCDTVSRLLHEKIEKVYGEGRAAELEAQIFTSDFHKIIAASGPYRYDVNIHRKVGYSEEEN